MPGAPPFQAAPDEPQAGTLGATLLEPTCSVRVQGTTFHVHRGVLKRIPFFKEQLNGDSGEEGHAAALELDALPCTAGEFAGLLAALYTRSPLGSTALPVRSFASAVRLAQAVALLLVEELFPELPGLLRALPRSREEAEAASSLAEQQACSSSMREALQSRTEFIEPESLRLMLLSVAEAPKTQDAALSVLAGCRSTEQQRAVARAASELFATFEQPKALWAGKLAQDWVHRGMATEIFRNLAGVREVHSRWDCPRRGSGKPPPGLLLQFCAHIRRCAADGLDVAPLVAMGKDTGTNISSQRFKCPDSPGCEVSYACPLAFDESCCNTLAAMVSPANSLSISRELATFPPKQLLQFATPELLQAMGPNAGPISLALLPSLGKLSEPLARAVAKGALETRAAGPDAIRRRQSTGEQLTECWQTLVPPAARLLRGWARKGIDQAAGRALGRGVAA